MNNIASDHPLSPEHLAALQVIAGKLIPASQTHAVPGADDDAIFAEIKVAATREVDILARGLDELLDSANVELSHLSPSEIQALVEGSTVPRFAGSLVTAIVECYYRDSRVMAALGKEPRPPFPQGYELPDGDWSMLDPVRERGPIWREAK